MDYPWNNQINFSTTTLLNYEFFHYHWYKTYKNLIVTLTRKSKNNQYSRLFSVLATNIMKVWKRFREIVSSNSKSSPSSIRIDCHLTSDPKVVVNGFDDFLHLQIFYRYCRIRNSFFLDHVNQAEVY